MQMALLGAAAAALMGIAAPAFAQLGPYVPEPGMTTNQSNAGTLDASGWTDARSAGGFSARFPCLYNEYSIAEGVGGRGHRGSVLTCFRDDGT